MAWLGAAGPARPLVGRGLGDPGDPEGRDPRDFVIETFLDLPAVHHVFDAWDGEGGLSHVGGHDAEPGARRRSPEHLRETEACERQCQQRKGQERDRRGTGEGQAVVLHGLQRDGSTYGTARGTQEPEQRLNSVSPALELFVQLS